MKNIIIILCFPLILIAHKQNEDYSKDLNKYKKGIYFLEIETDTGMILNKLILR